MEKFNGYDTYNPYNIRAVADRLSKKYINLNRTHIFWIAKELDIYPDGQPYKTKKAVDMTKMGKINGNNTEYVFNGRLNDKAIEAIEAFLVQEGYVIKKENGEDKMPDTKSIWEQADLIALMKQDYEKAIAERDKAKSEADEYAKMVDELSDKLLICEKENSELKAEKKELGKMQIEVPDFTKSIDSLQARIGKYNQELNHCFADINEMRKEISSLQTRMNQLQDNKKRLEGALSDIVGCSKRLMNMK